MTRIFARPVWLFCCLLIATFIPIVAAALRLYQIPLGLLPPDAIKLMDVPAVAA